MMLNIFNKSVFLRRYFFGFDIKYICQIEAKAVILKECR